MSGKARLKETLCAVSEFDTDEEILNKCPMNSTDMLKDDITE